MSSSFLARPSFEPRVLLVDDEPASRELLERALGSQFSVLSAATDSEGLSLLESEPVSVILADARMSQLNGAQLWRESIRQKPLTKRLLLTRAGDVDAGVQAVHEGQIHQFLQKPLEPETVRNVVDQFHQMYKLEELNQQLLEELTEVNARLQAQSQEEQRLVELEQKQAELLISLSALRERNAALEQVVFKDALTGLHNRRAFLERLKSELARTARSRGVLSVVLADMDHFQRINDQWGEATGDSVLRQMAQLFSGESPDSPRGRQSDVVARYGGEVFALILPDTDKEGARIKAERLREAVSRTTSSEHPVRATASFGVACYPEDGEAEDVLLRTARRSLLRAKEEGRNRVISSPRAAPPPQTLWTSYRDAQSELSGPLAQTNALSVITLSLPDIARIERHYGRPAARKLCQAFVRSVLSAAAEVLPPDRLLAAVAPRPDALDLCLVPGSVVRPEAPHYLEQVSAVLARRVELALRHHQSLGLVRVVGSHVTQLYARNAPVDHWLQQLSESARAQSSLGVQWRRSADRHEIQRLILNASITAVVQPIVAGDTGAHVGHEILSRGPLGQDLESPALLLDLAEEVELTPELDVCMVDAALMAASALPGNGLVFINVLAGTLSDEAFVKYELPRLMAKSEIRAERIVLEVSERQGADDLGKLAQAVEAVRAAGLAVGLDDVGSRNANLVEIAALHPDWLKLDRVLCTGLSEHSVKRDLIASLVEFGSKQRCRIIAEGVELKEQVDLLKSLQIHYFQGYFFGRPTAPPHFTAQRR